MRRREHFPIGKSTNISEYRKEVVYMLYSHDYRDVRARISMSEPPITRYTVPIRKSKLLRYCSLD
jgi:hypothetical protein